MEQEWHDEAENEMSEKPKIIDAHVHPIPTLLSPKTLLQAMDVAGVQTSILLGMDLDPEWETRSKKKTYLIIRRLTEHDYFADYPRMMQIMKKLLTLADTGNTLIAQWTQLLPPDRVIGIGSVNPTRPKNQVKAKLQQIVKLGLWGMKLLPTLQLFDPRKNKRNLKLIWKFAHDENLVIYYHIGNDPGPWELPAMGEDAHPHLIEKYLNKYDEARVVLPHLGGYSAIKPGKWLKETVEMIVNNSLDHVYLDTSAVPYLLHDNDVCELIRTTIGFNQILFGSDYPVVEGKDINYMINIIESSEHLTASEKENMLWKNARRFFEL